MPMIERSASHFPAICKALGYRKRKVWIHVSESVTFSQVNWDGGSKSEYHALDLATGKLSSPDMGRKAPWENPFEGMTVAIPDGVVIARTGYFCGKPSTLALYVNPANMPKLLGE
jgi:hypothetical protein